MVANRGEIAIRVLRSVSELGIKGIAIYTHEDRYSMHRYKADEAYQIGEENDPLKPYLNFEEIIDLAKEKNVDAIHPGYGFLSENVDFAKACEENGIIFIGPKSDSMNALGNKILSKEIAQKVGIPTIKGIQEDNNSPSLVLDKISQIGFPVIIKASAGGGGRGMRVAHNSESFVSLYKEAKNEAEKAFGDGTLFIEKYVDKPKHIEVQLLGDNYGNIVHLFERDCSVQRRFQKVVEVAPCNSISQETKDKLYDYAIRIAKETKYNNAGTVEFLVDKEENIFFIEVNPRIQVEHTVTEEITGIDIVRSQILIASGYKLSDSEVNIPDQSKIKKQGVAIQCRITTEDPENSFKPDFGTLLHYRNAGGFGIRLDEGSTYSGCKISPYFDSLLVKLTSRAETIELAVEKSFRTLKELKVRGVKTNIPFLIKVLSHPVFISGKANVNFLNDYPEIFDMKISKDVSTKILYFLGDIIVNGSKDIKGSPRKADFKKPISFKNIGKNEFPVGNKDRLNEKGPEGLMRWVKDQNKLFYTDTTFRDAHQSLFATRFRTIDMLKPASDFAMTNPNVFSMEVWGGATFDVAMRFLSESPWERLKALREAMPNMLLQMLIRGSNAVGYSAYPDNLIESFIEHSWKTGIDVFRIFDSLNWVEAMKPSIKAVLERTEAIAQVAICYTSDALTNKKYNIQYYLDLAKQIEDLGAHMIGIKDMSGLMKPLAAEELVTRLREIVDIPIHVHTHDTSSAQSVMYYKAADAGANVVDLALASVSGLTSQPNLNSFVEIMKGHPRECEMDIDSLNKHSKYWQDVRKYYYPFESGMNSGTAEVYQHEIPGGQYSNLLQQATALGVGDNFDQLIENYIIVNKMFGDLIKVTPSSKVVGDMAIFMTANNLDEYDIMTKGETLSFPESVKGFFKGDLGQPYGGFPKEVQKIVLKNEKHYDKRPNEYLDPINFNEEYIDFQKKFPNNEEGFLAYLSYKMYPAVYEDFYETKNKYGDLSVVPTETFFYGLRKREEVEINISVGKTIIVQYLGSSDPDEKGFRKIDFKLNGQRRHVDILDRSIKVDFIENAKAVEDHQVGSPLQGKIARILVEPKKKVLKNDPLFIVEAMKMETTVESPFTGTIRNVFLSNGAFVDQNDLVLDFKKIKERQT